MAIHCFHSVEFKRQVAQEFIAGETLHPLAKRHDASRTLIRVWVTKLEAVRGYAAHTRAHGECHFDHLIEGRLVARGAQHAIIFVLVDALERRTGVEHVTQPGQSTFQDNSNSPSRAACRKRGDGPLFVKAVLGGEGKHIGAAQLAIGRFAHCFLNGDDSIRGRRLPQHTEESFSFAHRSKSRLRGH
jgi:hypothetical protein